MATKLGVLFPLIFLSVCPWGCSHRTLAPTSSTQSNWQASEAKKDISSVRGPTKPLEADGFVDVTGKMGLMDVRATQIYAVDFDGDGYTDLVTLPEHYSIPEFYRFEPGDGKFVAINYKPFGKSQFVSYLYFCDLNKDGILDVIAGSMDQKTEITQHPLVIYRGEISKFSDSLPRIFYAEVEQEKKFKNFGAASLAILDFDLDGELDIYQGNWFDFSYPRPLPKADALLKGKEFQFEEHSSILENETERKRGIQVNARPTFGVSTCDIDQNGFPDILTAESSGHGNKLWLNIRGSSGDRIFKDYGQVSGYCCDKEGELDPFGGGNTFFAICADYNNDGIMDVAMGELTHSYDPDSRDRSSILTGSTLEFPPRFIRSEFLHENEEQNWNQGDRRGLWTDIDNDGLLDLLVENSGFPPKSRLILFRQENDHSYTDVAEQMGINILNPSGTVAIDFNQDGMPDLAVGQTSIRDSSIAPRIYLMENRIKRNGNRSLRFFLKAKAANAQGLGSMIILKTNKGLYRKWVEYSQGGLPSQNEAGMTFGLDAGSRPELVEVRWPGPERDRTGKNRPTLVQYPLSHLELIEHQDFTLCESGKLLKGNKNCP